MTGAGVGEVLDGVWRFEATHPEWTEDEGGEDGWEPLVAWWAVATPSGLALVDPLVSEWAGLDRLVDAHGGCAGIVRTCHWHERSIPQAATRYGATVWGGAPVTDSTAPPPDRVVRDRELLFDAVTIIGLDRIDELGLWLEGPRALVFGDAMLRRPSGELRVCPDSWLADPDGPARLRAQLRALTALAPEHVLVSHGPHVAGDAPTVLSSALR